MADDQPISFGPFRLFPKARLLQRDGAGLHIGGRALDILIFLAERPGEVVGKRELMKRVWADVNVDDGSLRFHITGLRKVLGDAGAQYVKNVPGRGYCFAAQPAPSGTPVAHGNASRPRRLPPRTTKLFGRTEAIEKISIDISQHRVITIVGPGGIGKTSVAIEVAHRDLSAFDEQVFFVDFGAVTDVKLAPGAIVSALGLTISSEDSIPTLLTFLRDRRTLLILDCCEHVLDVVAPLVEQITIESPETHILATSREAIRIESERVFRLLPLNCPPQSASFKAADILAYPATQLFVERAAVNSETPELAEGEASTIAEICQRLDGIPLAIELAAGRVNAYGVAGTASLLDGHMSLLWRGRRTAIPRHQTLSATLGWSYNLLSDGESATLRRVSAFSGPFTLEAAIAVASAQGVSKAEAAETIASLLSKSLIATHSERPLRYRLLDTMRSFAREKLAERGEVDQAARAHAQYFCDFFQDIATKSGGLPSDGRFIPHADQVANVRAALDWSFSNQGDQALGMNLAASAAQFFLELSLLTECHRWTQHAVTLLGAYSVGERQEMELQGALGASLMMTQGNTDAVKNALVRALQLAEQLDDPFWQLWILRLLKIYRTRIGDFQGALDAGRREEIIVRTLNDPVSAMYVQWSLGMAHHMIGNQRDAVSLCESALTQKSRSQQSYTLHLGYDNRIFALFALTRGLWLTGWPDRAVEAANYTIDEAWRLEQPLSLSLAFVFIIPVFLWVGDWVQAEHMIEDFVDHAARHGFSSHHGAAVGLHGELMIRRGDVTNGLEQLRRSQAALQAVRYRMMSTVFGTAEALALAQLHQFGDALRVIDRSIAEIGHGESFDMPEMLRVRGHILQSAGRTDEAETCLQRSLDLSRKQGALAWELRSAITLGRLWLGMGRIANSRALVQPLFDSYREGLDTADLVSARRFLESLN